MDTKTATDLLTDIIAQTNKFKHPEVHPDLLQRASDLIEQGADYQSAIKKQSNQKSISSLRLWGEILNNLVCDNNMGICWSVLAESCFTSTETTPKEIPQLILRLKDYIFPKETIIIFWSDPPQTKNSSPFGTRALIVSSLPNFNSHLQSLSFIQKNDFWVLPLQEKEISRASNNLIKYLYFTLSKN